MRILILLLSTAFLLAGCASLYKTDATTFELVSQNGSDAVFKYTSVADIYYPINSVEAEAVRMDWLKSWLRENGYRADQYEIISRVPIVMLKTQSESTTKYKIYYDVLVKKDR